MGSRKSELSFKTFTSFPTTGALNTLYIATDTNVIYYWDGSDYKATGSGGGGTPATAEWPVIKTVVSISPLVAYTRYLVDASLGVITMTLPDVTPGITASYNIFLENNGNHILITTVGGTQLIQGKDEQGIRNTEGMLTLKANGVDGYDIIEDTRVGDNPITVTANLDLSNGFESGAVYYGEIPDGTEVTILIDDWKEIHAGDYASFIKLSGENSTFRIISEDGNFNEIITTDDKGFTISTSNSGYTIKQDSRPSASDITVTFYPTDNISIFEPTYAGVLETSNPTEETLVSPAITSSDSLNPTFLGYFINDDKALIGTFSERAINSIAQIKLTSAFNRTARIKFKYFEYDFGTLTLNPVELSETGYSSIIDDNVSFESKTVSGILPENTWALENGSSEKILVVGLYGVKNLAAGDNPTLDFLSGGTTPSVTTINVPVASINHNTLGGVVLANIGVPDGHIDNKYPIVFPNLTTTERDAIVSPIASMKIYNTTTGTYQNYDGANWVDDGGGGGGDTVNFEILSADKTLVDGDDVIQMLDPNGADRIISMPVGVLDMRFRITNNADDQYSSNYLSIKTNGGTEFDKLYVSGSAIYIFNGTVWVSEDGLGGTQFTNRGMAVGKNTNGRANGVAIGYFADSNNSGTAIGYFADGQSTGVSVGYNTKGYTNGVAIGWGSRGYTKGVSIGYNTYGFNQGIAIGYQANSSLNTNSKSGAIGFDFKNAKDNHIAFCSGTGTTDTTSARIGFDFSETGKVAQEISDSSSAPTTTTNKLYSVAGSLYRNGTLIA